MQTSKTLDIRALIDESPVSKFQWLVIGLCFCIVAMDGFDVAIMGFIAPELKRLWGVTNGNLGGVISAALIGLSMGAMVAGPLADQFGRKVVLVLSVFFFGFWTLMAANADDVSHLILFRFLTGLGLGGAMPNTATLVSEFAPEKRRSFIVTVVFAGFTLGAAGGGFLAAWLIPHFGFRSVLVVGGAMPIVLSVCLLVKLPESLRFLVEKKQDNKRIANIVAKLAPHLQKHVSETDIQFYSTAPIAKDNNAMRIVLSSEFRFGTMMFWVTYFMGLFLVYLMGSWMPTMIKESGYSVSEAAVVTAFFQVAGPLGSVFLGWCMDRKNPHHVLGAAFLLGGLLLIGLSLVAHQFVLLVVFAFLVGFCFNGANTGMNALTSSFYPTAARATGTSWMHGVGRTGAILSAFAGAQMLAMGWTFTTVFTVLTIPAVIAASAVLAKGIASSKRNRNEVLFPVDTLHVESVDRLTKAI